MDNKRVKFIKKIIVMMPVIFSLLALIFSIVALVKISDINRRLKSVSLNSYVEQTLVSNNYILNEEEKGTTAGGSAAEGSAGIAAGTDEVQPERIKVYLTFDDGPSINTGKILDILKKHNIKATFFMNGTASEYPELEPLYKRIVDEGNGIGMHSYTHKYEEIYASEEAFEADLDKIHSLIYNETGVDTALYRFPGGSGNTVTQVPMETLAGIVHSKGYEYYDWNIYPGDRSGRSYPKEEIVSSILDNISGYRSAIILLHDSDNHVSTVEALPEVIEGLLAMDVEFCVMDDSTPVIQQVVY